jgi:hypothetical protein
MPDAEDSGRGQRPLLHGEQADEIDRLIAEVRGLALIVERLHLGGDVAMDTAIRELVGGTDQLRDRWDEVY